MYKTKIKIYLFTVFCYCLLVSAANACSLALHDWQLVYYSKIPINAPFIPMSEISAIQGQFKKPVTDKILWVTKIGVLTPYVQEIVKKIDGWVGQAEWKVLPDNKSVIKIAKEAAKNNEKPIIVGSDKNFFKIAVFVDKNSDNRCIQVVLAQDSRIRCVYQNPTTPWAQEFNMQSWVSLIFYELPLPGRIISFSTYPVSGTRLSIYEDHPLVEQLLSKRCLTRRPDLVIDPYAFDFPDLPE